MTKYQTKTFPTADLRLILWDELPDNSPYKKIDTVAGSEGRWSINYELIFSHNDLLYSAPYESGTGDSGVAPFEYDGDTVLCNAVEIVPVTVNTYVPIKA